MHDLHLLMIFAILLLVGLIGGCVSTSPAQGAASETPFQAATGQSTPTQIASATSTLILAPTPSAGPKTATSFPDPSLYLWSLITNGLSNPVSLANAGDGSGRIFIVEKAGTIRVIVNDQVQPVPFLDIRDRVGSCGNEQGLLGLAFHPQFAKNGYFYVNYTGVDGNTVIARFTATGNNPTNQVADPSSEFILLRVDQPFSNHNGGEMGFGPDGMLWMGLGDGGSGGDPYGNGQSAQTLLGKILRIDVDHGDPFAIPAGNPFASGGGLPEIWALGLRNPWRFSFDAATGDLYIGDVGQDKYEEIDFLPAGFNALPANFGWSIREGLHSFKNTPNDTATALIDPIFEYSHSLGCSVTGGFVYRGHALPDFNGIYFFGDYCSGRVWGLLGAGTPQVQTKELFATGLNISSFGVDESGELYLLDLNGGVYRLQLK